MLGKLILFLVAWSILKQVVKAIRPELARLGPKRRRGEGADADADADTAPPQDGPARDLIPVDPADPLAGTVLPGSRPGVCRDCGTTYSLPGDFPTSLAQCDACGGIVEVGSVVRLSSDLTPASPAHGVGLPGAGAASVDEPSRPHLPEGQDQASAEEPAAELAPEPEPAAEGKAEAPGPEAGGPPPMPQDAPEPKTLPAPVEDAASPGDLEPRLETTPNQEPAAPEQSSAPPAPDLDEPPAPQVLDAAACAEADAALELLGERGLTGMAIRDAFAAEHQGLALRLEGTVQRVESYGHDAHFGSTKGPRLVLDTAADGVRAVVLLPEGTAAPERGARVVAHGRAVGADPYLRALFLAGGSASPA